MSTNPRNSNLPAPYNVGIAYILWAMCFFGASGLHRLYMGKIGTGLLWLFTFGCCYLGNFIDLFLIPGMVEDSNFRHRLKLGFAAGGNLFPESQPTAVGQQRESTNPPSKLTPERLRIELVRAAAEMNGRLSVTQAVLATGADFKVVEDTLQAMLRSGYIGIDNDPDTGVVVYTFPELKS
ncbi:MAG: TM2 domain-containing protein [Cyanobacteria bacterium]|nr:TM2 domain-containing protein [Cyanobacteriota bacterium]MDW8200108.1 TM2 domain-containing protein [Cyanobacteriota bacterium SKYGB_h_bin112]